jgi:hypothetical protein
MEIEIKYGAARLLLALRTSSGELLVAASHHEFVCKLGV